MILNNGIEFAVTFIMLLALFFTGGGSTSFDYWIVWRFRD